MGRTQTFLFCVFALNINKAQQSGVTLPPAPFLTSTPGPFLTSTPGPAWETRNLDRWMISVMPYASVSFRSVPLSKVTGITLCLRAVTEKNWLVEDVLELTFGETRTIYMNNYYSDYDYRLAVAGSDTTFNRNSMVPVQEARSVWKSRCLTWDSRSGMAQLWFDGTMSVRKGLSRGTVFSGQAELTMLQFEGQVSDVYLWDSVLSVRELHRYLYHHSVPARNRDWTQMQFRANGYVVLEPAYPKRLPAGPAKHNKQKRMKALKKRQRQKM